VKPGCNGEFGNNRPEVVYLVYIEPWSARKRRKFWRLPPSLLVYRSAKVTSGRSPTPTALYADP